MTGTHSKQKSTTPPADFVQQVKQVLENLYDFPYLQRHPLAQQVAEAESATAEAASQRLRREFMAAIETLNPGDTVSFLAPQARTYNLLHLHYVEGITVQETANELGISSRQAYRDLRQAEESVATLLWAKSHASKQKEVRARTISSVHAEMERLDTQPHFKDTRALLRIAQQAVERLALQKGIELRIDTPAVPIAVLADPTVAQQILVGTLSQAIQQAQSNWMDVRLARDQDHVSLTLRYILAEETPLTNRVLSQLIERLGWMIKQEQSEDGLYIECLQIPAYGPTILVIDDNEGLVELLERYLTDQACRVVAATSGQEGLRLAQELKPNAIILDVMMPEMDGWEVLQRLRTSSINDNIPVIICSVFNDPELAHSLGASFLLSKPIRRDDILTVLRQFKVV